MNVLEFRPENKEIAFACIGVLILLVVVYCFVSCSGEDNDTDVTVERIEERIDDAGKRVDAVADTVGKVEESVRESVAKIESSRKDAEAIAGGLAECESRLDDIIQRHGRIANIIADIENANK